MTTKRCLLMICLLSLAISSFAAEVKKDKKNVCYSKNANGIVAKFTQKIVKKIVKNSKNSK